MKEVTIQKCCCEKLKSFVKLLQTLLSFVWTVWCVCVCVSAGPSFHDALHFSAKKHHTGKGQEKKEEAAVTSSYNFKLNTIYKMKMEVFMSIKLFTFKAAWTNSYSYFYLNFGPVAFIIVILPAGENMKSFTQYCVARAGSSKSALCIISCVAGAPGMVWAVPYQMTQTNNLPKIWCSLRPCIEGRWTTSFLINLFCRCNEEGRHFQ